VWIQDAAYQRNALSFYQMPKVWIGYDTFTLVSIKTRKGIGRLDGAHTMVTLFSNIGTIPEGKNAIAHRPDLEAIHTTTSLSQTLTGSFQTSFLLNVKLWLNTLSVHNCGGKSFKKRLE